MTGITAKTVVAVALLTALLCAMATPVSAYEYHREIAAKYALANAYRDIPASQYFENRGGDCTNFVSWHLRLAGWREVGSIWNRKSDNAWFYDFVPGGHSYSWGGANNFYRFLSKSDRVYPVSIRYRSHLLQIGDIVQMDYKDRYGNYGSWDHTMIVTGKNGNDPLVSYHSGGEEGRERNKALSEIRSENRDVRFIGWHVEDTYYN